VRVLLIDVDSKIPNLALMKIAAWHKSQGDVVGFDVADPDLVYASVVFKHNAHAIDGLRFFYPNAKILVGGSGVSLKTKLPDEIENIDPDYTLYDGLICQKCGNKITSCNCTTGPTPGNMFYSIGFSSRGCIRKCYFCIVQRKEGEYKRGKHPREWVKHDRVKLLDNNWYADPDWFFETSQWFIDNGVAIDVTQGMDIRLMTPEIAERLRALKWWKRMHFAFDDDKEEDAVKRGISVFKELGMTAELRNEIMFLVYTHDDNHFESALRRCRTLKELGTTAFVMANIDKPRSKRVKHLQKWANRPWLYWTIDFEEFYYSKKKRGRSPPKGRLDIDAEVEEIEAIERELGRGEED